MRRIAAVFIIVLTALAMASPASARLDRTPFCGIYWGSLKKADDDSGRGEITNVRVGRHACFDRLVVDVRGDVEGYRVSYVNTVATDGAGTAVALRGGADLEIVVRSPAYDSAGRPTYSPANRTELASVRGWDTFRQVSWAGSYEGQTTLGLGVRARLPFRVFTLDGPGNGSRLVIDVAHRW